jgi:pilus assembly protein CpaF
MAPLKARAIAVGPVDKGRAINRGEHEFQALKAAIHEELVDSLDLTKIGQIGNDRLLDEVRRVAEEICYERGVQLKGIDRDRMLKELLDEVFGLGPLEALMADDEISDILVNNSHEVYIERRGRLELTDIVFADDQHVLRIIQRVVARVGRRIDEVSPMVDARLADGSRINAVVPPLAIDGPTLSIRRFGAKPLGIEDLASTDSLTSDMVDFLAAAIDARVSFLVSGGTGAGKTTLLNALTAFIPSTERLVTIEDSAELRVQNRHVIRLETRPANTEERGQVTQRDLVRNALRMRPDRIIVGEVRGSEALDMLQAMNTGHEGSLTTIHANDTRDALSRLEVMVAMTGYDLPVHVVRQYIASGIKLIVHVSRLKGGQRKVTRISEIVGIRDNQFVVEDIFGFEQTGVNEDGNACGTWFATGYRPQCLARFRSAGVVLSDSLFEPRNVEAVTKNRGDRQAIPVAAAAS